MERSVESKLTIYFEEPFWVGVFEELDGDKLSVCRTVFGAEPTDAEIYDFILKHYYHLRFSAPVKTEIRQKADNPKRLQRNARKQLEKSGIGTKSQQALQKQYEENKTERNERPASKGKLKNSGSLSSNSRSVKKNTEDIREVK